MGPRFVLLYLAWLVWVPPAPGDVPVDMSHYDASCQVQVVREGDRLRAAWDAGDGRRGAAVFDVTGRGPLLDRIELAPAGGAPAVALARSVRPEFSITVGVRKETKERYVFFDRPAAGPTETHVAALALQAVRVEGAGPRAAISFSKLSAGPFSGDLVLRLYAGSPLLHVEAAMRPDRDGIAYIYDAVLAGDFPTLAWKNLRDEFVRESPEGAPRPVAVRHRAIFAESAAGTLAVFPPPHAFFFPRDRTDNLKFAQAGKGRFGLRQAPDGGGAFVPWFDAPAGRTQRMGMFVLLDSGTAEAALERVLRYTRGDAFKPLDGRVTFTSHWHSRITVSEMAGKPAAPELVRLFKAMNVNIVHLAEFHGDGHARDPGPQRLPELRAMFDVCRRNSDERLLLLPGEEGTGILAHPRPGIHPGHWMVLFPRPVYFTFVRGAGAPFEETVKPFGTVYHVDACADMVELLRRAKGLAWTTHPRIKASHGTPDAYKDDDFYRDDRWLGAAWKAMPADLSDPRLGVRALDVLDDMNTWGPRKVMPGEVDVFEIDRSHELYGHMNVNYLRLPKVPSFDDWSPVLDVLRRGDFFVTTGEVLIDAFEVKDGRIAADLEWTFPLASVEIVDGGAQGVKRRSVALPETAEFERKRFEWPLEGSDARWVRLEAWDVAGNGAFTQPVWLKEGPPVK